MDYQVIVSDEAVRQITEHVRFLSSVSRPAALQLKRTFVDAMRSLSFMPQRFPFLDAECIPKNKYRKMIVESRYMFLYQVRDENVFLDYVIDCRQDYGWMLR